MNKNFHKIVNYKGVYYYYYKKNIFVNRNELEHISDVEVDNHSFKLCQNNNQIISKFIIKKRRVLILQVTQACNMKCKYCVYSDEFSRNCSNLYMSFDIAKKAVDMHFKHSVSLICTSIGFYGGEPLLNFSLIKDIINYIKINYSCRTVYYNVTTNGTLLNDEIIDFLIENKFNVMISLDGPKKIHDDKRIDLNNCGTFNKVMNAINTIKRKNKTYFNNNISFNSVTSNIYEESLAEDFFRKKLITNYSTGLFSLSKEISKVKLSDNTIKSISNDIIKKSLVSLLEYRANMRITFKAGIINYKFLKDLENINSVLSNVNGNKKITKFHPKGQCIPSHTRCFIDVKGNIYPCEKVNELNKFLILGNVYCDVDEKKAINVYNFAKFACCKCNECWALHFCNLCVAKILESNFSSDVLDNYCKSIRGVNNKYLSALIILKKIFSSYYYKCEKL